MLCKREDLIYLDMKVEEALKYVISCGVISANFKPLTEQQLLEKIDTENNAIT
jgi:uncharacterized membrane protein